MSYNDFSVNLSVT